MKLEVNKKLILCFMAVFIALLSLSCSSKVKYELQFLNGQSAFVFNGEKEEAILNDNSYELYSSVSDEIKIRFESMNMDSQYQNVLVLGNSVFPLSLNDSEQMVFTEKEIKVLGANVKNGEIIFSIESGLNFMDTYDSFLIRNVRIIIGDIELWPNEYTKENYLNTPVAFGNPDQNANYRSNYQIERTYTFSIPDDLLDVSARLVDFDDEVIVYQESSKKSIDFANTGPIDFEVNLNDNDVLDEDFTLNISSIRNATEIQVTMDGVAIPQDIHFYANAWAEGEHELRIVAENDFGFYKEEVINFTLSELMESASVLEFTHYETGINQQIPNSRSNLGVMINETINWESPFSSYSVQNFEINHNNDDTSLVWKGKAPLNRSVYLQLYNHNTEKFDTVSTHYVREKDEPITLGFDYGNHLDDYLNDSKVLMRVVSENKVKEFTYDTSIFHVTDIQYISQKASSTSVFIKGQAEEALNDMNEYIVNEYKNDDLAYLITTGDYVQSVSKGSVEWPFVMEEFFQPLLNEEVPFGVLSGNHDIGALSEVSVDGVNALDKDLYYDYFYQYLGRETFVETDHFSGDFENNRSHYDIVKINGQDYLFLYLGWGSSFKGLHVSSKDVNYAKSVLEANLDKRVVLMSHEYMNNRGVRTITGTYIFNELVSKYHNIDFVFSGHVNGSSKRVDFFDSNQDGIIDRQVFQMLTNFQEEEQLYGATFIRRIRLNFSNNQMFFDLYSPYFNDSDIFVANNLEEVRENRFFIYDYDLDNVGYGLLTSSLE